MEKTFALSEIDQIAEAVRARIKGQPRIAVILGSGLGSLAEAVEGSTVIPLSPYCSR